MIPAALGPEMLLYGIAVLWALSLVPAAIVTLLKGRWSLWLAGWLTLGIAWIVGAVALGPADSWWARRFHGEKRLSRAAEPLRHPRPPRTIALGALAILTTIVVVGFFAARPAPVVGVGGRALERSVDGSLLFGGSPCRRNEDGSWRCGVYDGDLSGDVTYRVDMDGLGCWTAIRAEPAGPSSPKRLTGCVTIADYLLRG